MYYGPEFVGKAMLTWAHRNGVTLRGPKRILGGLTPVEYARRLAEKALTMPGKL